MNAQLLQVKRILVFGFHDCFQDQWISCFITYYAYLYYRPFYEDSNDSSGRQLPRRSDGLEFPPHDALNEGWNLRVLTPYRLNAKFA